LRPETHFADWREFEDYVYGLLLTAKPALAHRNLAVHKHRRMRGNRTTWTIDVEYELDVLGIRHVVLVECKYFARKVTRREASYLLACVQDVGAAKGILVSNQGFTAGAREVVAASPVLLLQVPELFGILEADLLVSLKKRLFRDIIDMRDEAIWVPKVRGFGGDHGRFVEIQSELSQYVDFPHRFPLPLAFSRLQLDGQDSAPIKISSKLEYVLTVIDNIAEVRKQYGDRYGFAGCEYTQQQEAQEQRA